MTALALAALKHWRLIAGGLGVLLLGLYIASLKAEVRHFSKALESCQLARKLEHEAVRRRTAEANAADAVRVVKVERKQSEISNTRSQSYESRISDLRARHAAKRVRASAATGADQGGGGAAPVSEASAPAGQPDAAAPSSDLMFNCQANAIQLEELQRWVREQAAIPE